MDSKRNELSDNEKAVITETFLSQVSSLIKDFEKVNDPKVQNAIRQLQDVKGNLEKNNTSPTRDWAATIKLIVGAGNWIRIIYDFFQ